MIAFDTNILVYAHRADNAFHSRARDVVRASAEGSTPWGLLWPCLHEFVAIVTHPRIYKTPTPLAQALRQVRAWLTSPTAVVLGEEHGYWECYERIAAAARIQGAKLHDARIAALAIFHRVGALYTADRDFSRFAELNVNNPL